MRGSRELLVERLGRVHVHVDADEVDQRARAHRPARAVRHRLRRGPRASTRASSSTRTQSFRSGISTRLTTKPGVSWQRIGCLPSRLAERVRGLERLVARELGADDLDERHHRRRVEEVHADDALGRRRRRGDLRHRERGRVRREHGVGAADALELARRAPASSASSSTIASITRSQSARSASSVVSVRRPSAASRAACSSWPFSTLRVRKCSMRSRARSPSSSRHLAADRVDARPRRRAARCRRPSCRDRRLRPSRAGAYRSRRGTSATMNAAATPTSESAPVRPTARAKKPIAGPLTTAPL